MLNRKIRRLATSVRQLDLILDAVDLEAVIDFAEPIGQSALRALQSEHRLWVRRGLDLAVDRTEARASLLTLAAKWHGISGDHGEALRLALEAIDCGAPDSPSTAASQVTVAFSNGMLGRFAEASRAIEAAERALDGCGDEFTFVEGHAVLHPLVVIGSPGRRDAHRDLVHRAARALDNGIADAIVGRMDVVEHIRSGRVDQAVWLLPSAVECAEQAGARSIEMDLRSMAVGTLAPDDPAIPERYVEVLSALKDYDYGETIWSVLELLGSLWAEQGRTACAATVLGHLRVNERRYPNPVVQARRARYLDPVASDPDAAAGLDAGAAMTRSELVNYAIATLRDG